MKIINSYTFKNRVLASNIKKDVSLKGVLRQADDGFCFLEISNNVIHGLFTLIDEDDIEKPPYFGKSKNGAHISVISFDEAEKLGDTKIEEIGQEFNFELGEFKSVNPEGWDDMKRVWFVEVDVPEIKELRRKYKLPSTYNGKGHKFHITIAVRKKK
tara:strand:+ start:12647 stop:13117 length:471 start_codon:yes stop_codon:yes gene_type:complete